MKKLICLTVVFCSGCSHLTSTVIETKTGDRTTKVSIGTFWDSKSALTKMGSGQTKTTQKVSVEGLQEESSGTNTTAAIEAVVAGAIRALTKP